MTFEERKRQYQAETKGQRNDILKDTFCIYCQREYASPANLQRHVATRHPGTYADASIKEAKDARSDG